MQTVLGLLWSTGMRPNEVASLKYKDFDIENNLIKIHDTKLHKDRTFPIHESVSIKIKEYILFLNDHKIYPDENYALFYTTNQNLFH